MPGAGDLSHWMREYREVYREATGTDLVPGSLNVELPTEWQLPMSPRVRLERSQVGVGMTLVPCRIEGYPAFVARTDSNEAGVGRHPRTIIEIVAGVGLRRELGLRDGDSVEVVVPDVTDAGSGPNGAPVPE